MKKRSSSQKSPKRTVKTKGTQERVTIGMDLGDKTSRYCVLSKEGEILHEGDRSFRHFHALAHHGSCELLHSHGFSEQAALNHVESQFAHSQEVRPSIDPFRYSAHRNSRQVPGSDGTSSF